MYKHVLITIPFMFSLACSAKTSNASSEKVVERENSTKEINSTPINNNEVSIIETTNIEKGTEKKVAEIIRSTAPQTKQIDKTEKITVKSTPEKTIEKTEETTIEETEEATSTPSEIVASTPSHASFDGLLKKYVTSSGKVNYNGFKGEKSKLDAYLVSLGKNAPTSSWSRNEKLSYWINLYNAATIQLILKNMPIKSIMDINGGKAWDIKFVKSGSRTLSLNQIENEIIRPTFKEPRIHFAVNCAAKSCPKILNAAFLPHTLDKQLETATKKFINNTTKNTITPSSITISKIFEWYGNDFGGKSQLINYFNKYSNTKINSSATINFKEYDWKLNN